MKSYTIEQVKALGPCYIIPILREMYKGAESLTPLEWTKLGTVDDWDLAWAICRKQVLGKHFSSLILGVCAKVRPWLRSWMEYTDVRGIEEDLAFFDELVEMCSKRTTSKLRMRASEIYHASGTAVIYTLAKMRYQMWTHEQLEMYAYDFIMRASECWAYRGGKYKARARQKAEQRFIKWAIKQAIAYLSMKGEKNE